jgi:hypothetical protein
MAAGHCHQSLCRREPASDLLLAAALAGMLFWRGQPSDAQTQVGCRAASYRVVSQSWDVVLKRGWEWRQDCDHPDWPLRLAAMGSAGEIASSPDSLIGVGRVTGIAPERVLQPVLVNAGNVVRLWMQDDTVRIEMSGVVERSAHQGERVVVQVTRLDDKAGLTVQRIPGIVSGANEVEMEP